VGVVKIFGCLVRGFQIPVFNGPVLRGGRSKRKRARKKVRVTFHFGREKTKIPKGGRKKKNNIKQAKKKPNTTQNLETKHKTTKKKNKKKQLV